MIYIIFSNHDAVLYSMTPRMFITALVQYASSTLNLSANVRFRWEYKPGSYRTAASW